MKIAEPAQMDAAARTRAAIRGLISSEDELLPPGLTGRSVAITSNQTSNANAQIALLTAVNLSLRIDPVIDALYIGIPDGPLVTRYPGTEASTIHQALENMADWIDCDVDLFLCDPGAGDAKATLALGRTQRDTSAPEVAIASNGWTVNLAAGRADDNFGEQLNPVGASYAACLGIAEMFKVLTRSSGVENPGFNISPVEALTFSAYDYTVGNEITKNPDLPETLDLTGTSVIGTGAGGGALTLTLALLPELVGRLGLVDSDEVTITNLNRYLWVGAGDTGRPKVSTLKDLLDRWHPQLDVTPVPEPFESVSNGDHDIPMELVASTVHTAEARQEIQWELPGTVLDAGVNDRGDYVTARIRFGESECLGCKYPPGRSGRRRELNALADRIGLDRTEVQRLNQNNGTFTRGQVNTVQQAASRDPDLIPPTVGERFSDWYHRHCGHLEIEGGGEPVPIPFLPVAAGVLLAGEVIKDRMGLRGKLSDRFLHNIFCRPKSILHRETIPAPDCVICGEDSREIHREKWGST